MSIKKTLLVPAVFLSLAQPALADPGIFLGLAYTFGGKGGFGITVKVTSTKKEDKLAAAAGLTWYPQDKTTPIGFDLGLAYLFDNAAVGVGWDFLHSPQIWAAGGDTEGRKQTELPPIPEAPSDPGPIS